MNRIYAATVPVGWEMKVKKHIDRFCNPMVQVLRGDEWRKNDVDVQSVSQGYIYLRMPSDDHAQMRPDLYHQIKSLPYVYSLLQKPIPEEEMQSYFNNLPSDVVEITVPEMRQETLQQEQEQWHQANMEGDMAQKKALMKDLEKASPSSVQALEETRKEAKQVGAHRMIAACYAVVRQNKVKFTFPKSLAGKAYQNMQKQGMQAVHVLHLIPAVIRMMKGELRLE